MVKYVEQSQDLYYVDTVLEILTGIETCLKQRSELKRSAEEKLQTFKRAFALIIGIIGAVIVTIFVLIFGSSQMSSIWAEENLVKFSVVAFVVSTLVFIGLAFFLEKTTAFASLEKKQWAKIMENVLPQRVLLKEKVTALLEREELTQKIPEKYLSTKCLTFIRRYMQTNQASALHIAIEMFEMDLNSHENKYAAFLSNTGDSVSEAKKLVESWSKEVW